MTTDDVDADALRTELDQIKAAMGIQDRYSGAIQQWLLYAVLVAVASALSQFVVLERLSGWYHFPVWVGVFGGGAFLGTWYLDRHRDEPEPGTPKPSLAFQFAVVFLAFLPIQFVFGPITTEASYLVESATILGLVLVLLGLSYLLMGNALRAHYIRRRDRLALHVGGVLMVALGVAVPNVEALHTWGFTAFGVTYVAYALGAYAVLSRD